MAEPKTKKNDASVEEFIASIKTPERQKDARTILRLFRGVTGEKPKMWGTAIVGFGEFEYRYADGSVRRWLRIGFSPRAQNLTLYIMAGFKNLQPLLKKLGKHTTGASCLYIKRLSEIDSAVLEAVVRQGLKESSALEGKSEAFNAAKSSAASKTRKAIPKKTTRPSSKKTTRTTSKKTTR